MIPLRDNIPSRNVPYINYSIITLNVFVFLLELSIRRYLPDFFAHFGIVPVRYSVPSIAQHFSAMEQIIPFFTSMFLHGGWLHIIGNMWILYIFGDNVEDRLGHIKYLIFYLICGVLSGMFHLATNWHSPLPTIGASGAIAGIMGAYFFLFPHARVLVLFPIFFFIQIFEVPAYFFLGFWFLMQFFNGAMSLGNASAHIYGGVAWWAHIGGFLAGLYLVQMIIKNPPRVRKRSIYY
ncbi:MAG: rhomboid family intramembrane serine protease [Candidatus Auribacterota bacterium]